MYAVPITFLILIGGGIWVVAKQLMEIIRIGDKRLTITAVAITIFAIVMLIVRLACSP